MQPPFQRLQFSLKRPSSASNSSRYLWIVVFGHRVAQCNAYCVIRSRQCAVNNSRHGRIRQSDFKRRGAGARSRPLLCFGEEVGCAEGDIGDPKVCVKLYCCKNAALLCSCVVCVKLCFDAQWSELVLRSCFYWPGCVKLYCWPTAFKTHINQTSMSRQHLPLKFSNLVASSPAQHRPQLQKYARLIGEVTYQSSSQELPSLELATLVWHG